jgi:hypothetical protein
MFVLIPARDSRAQLAGIFHTAPGTTGTYAYHAGEFQTAVIPIDVSFRFPIESPTSQLSAIIHKPIISVLPSGEQIFPNGLQYPMAVRGTSYNGRDFHGDLMGSPYLFDWTIERAANGELVWNGIVGWAGGRYEQTTISNARLIPGLAGDFNDNDRVDAADYVAWRKGLGTTFSQAQYNEWRDHFGTAFGANSPSAAGVPEPAILATLTMGILAMVVRARRS